MGIRNLQKLCSDFIIASSRGKRLVFATQCFRNVSKIKKKVRQGKVNLRNPVVSAETDEQKKTNNRKEIKTMIIRPS